MPRCVVPPTHVMPQLHERRGQETKPFLRAPTAKICKRLLCKSRSQSLWYRTVHLHGMSDWLIFTGRRERKRGQESSLAKKVILCLTQGLSGDGVDPAVVTSWVILETTRSAISCLSSSTCSPIRGIELSITCHKKEKQQLIKRFPGGRCLFQLTFHANLLYVPMSLSTHLVLSPLHAETC